MKAKGGYGITPYACLVTTSLALAIFTISDLEWEEHVSIQRGTLLFLLGLVFFTSLFNFFNVIVLRTNFGQKLMRKYQLSVTDVLDISNKEVSAIQALFCCMTGATICTYSCTRNMLRTSHYISEAYAWFGAAYFFYDIWSMYRVQISASLLQSHMNGEFKHRHPGSRSLLKYLKKNFVMVMHHIFIGCFGFLFITYIRGGLGDCFFGFIYLMEASTPFVSLRGVLSKIGLKTSNLYIVNGLVMLTIFFLCRIAMFPYVVYLYADSVNLDYLTAVKSLPMGCKISISILLYPQIYWFYLMLKGATRVLKPRIVGGARRKHGKHS